MLEFAEGGHPQFQCRELRWVTIYSEHFARFHAQHGERIVAGRGNREAGETRLNAQSFEENVGVFPTLGVTHSGKVAARRDFARHEPPRSATCALSLYCH